MEPKQPTWTYVLDSIFKFAGLAVPTFAFFWIAMPARQDESRLAGLESQVKAIGIEQAPLESRTKTAQATIAEQQADQMSRPAVQVTPKIEQFGSIEDIREIRLSLLLANVGDADSTVQQISVQVDDGTPTREVAEILARTQQYYYRRMEYRYQQPTDDLFGPTPTPVEQADYVAPAPNNSSTESNYYRWLPLPAHDNCPHGRVFAIGANSPDVQWKTLKNATQVLNRRQVLRPQQSATHHFTFLLTEYPMQHNRQWIRFSIAVDQESSERQEYALLVSGLPLPPCSADETVSYQCCSQSAPCVWQPDAPLMPINSKDSGVVVPAPGIE